MKATELRIGNYVGFGVLHTGLGQEKDFAHYTVDELTDQCIFFIESTVGEFYEDVEPIFLTEEWLLKFGFKIFDTIRFLDDGYNVWKKMPNSRFNLYTIDKKKWICRILDHDLVEVEYLHWLQNLYFALNNEELIILKTI